MANIKLKDASGKEVSYNDVDKIIVPSTSGGTTEFLAGGVLYQLLKMVIMM